jgi:hypothetical protein
MMFRHWMLGLLVLAGMLSASAAELKLAGVRLGMRPQEVTKLLLEPTAIIIAQPAIGGGAPSTPTAMMPPGMAPAQPAKPAQQDTTMILVYKKQEFELDPNASISTDMSISKNQIPSWIYTVRVAHLGLNQQELIYRINDTYSLGITITGEDREARVTDIIACSLLPLTTWPTNPKREFDRSNSFYKGMFNYKYGDKKDHPAGTSKKVTIGSKLNEVLLAHKWPDYFIPFTTTPAATMTLDPRFNTPVFSSGGSQQPDYGSTSFAMGNSSLNIGFANNCVLLYPDDGLALTLINQIVVRVQIGKEMLRPSMEDFVPGGNAGAVGPPARPQP